MTLPMNIGMPSLRRFVSPLSNTRFRKGSSPLAAACCAEVSAR
jgi:hypothetical protein